MQRLTGTTAIKTARGGEIPGRTTTLRVITYRLIPKRGTSSEAFGRSWRIEEQERSIPKTEIRRKEEGNLEDKCPHMG